MPNYGKIRGFLKKNTSFILKISLGLYAVCYVICYFSGLSSDSMFMRISLVVACLANILPALL